MNLSLPFDTCVDRGDGRCMICEGECCHYCGAGSWRPSYLGPACEHDVDVRHQQNPPHEECCLLCGAPADGSFTRDLHGAEYRFHPLCYRAWKEGARNER